MRAKLREGGEKRIVERGVERVMIEGPRDRGREEQRGIESRECDVSRRATQFSMCSGTGTRGEGT